MTSDTSTTRPNRARRLAIDGWFTDPADGQPHLIGTRCSMSGSYFFPPERVMSRAPGCADATLTDVELSTSGTLWSYTDARYQPPPPYVPVSDPHEPFAIAAVELDTEKIVVLGQVVTGVSVTDLRVGMQMELVTDVLYTETDDDGNEVDVIVWKWRPADTTEDSGAQR